MIKKIDCYLIELRSVWKNNKPKAKVSDWYDELSDLNWAFPNLYQETIASLSLSWNLVVAESINPSVVLTLLAVLECHFTSDRI